MYSLQNAPISLFLLFVVICFPANYRSAKTVFQKIYKFQEVKKHPVKKDAEAPWTNRIPNHKKMITTGECNWNIYFTLKCSGISEYSLTSSCPRSSLLPVLLKYMLFNTDLVLLVLDPFLKWTTNMTKRLILLSFVLLILKIGFCTE